MGKFCLKLGETEHVCRFSEKQSEPLLDISHHFESAPFWRAKKEEEIECGERTEVFVKSSSTRPPFRSKKKRVRHNNNNNTTTEERESV